MSKRVFIWVGHPNKKSLCSGLADAYQAGAESIGAEVIRMDLADMNLKPLEDDPSGADTGTLEPDIVQWRANLAWADHVLFIHPYWWAGMPAKAKAVLDRGLASGFAYKYRGRGASWDKLLAGRTADAFITSDTPPLIDRFIYGRPGRRVIKNQVLEFCGIKTRKVIQFGSVKLSSDEKKLGWIARAEQLGASLAA
ncbi:NAD(P)H-dependent oxidoreductase [Hyphobacterium sp. HN65]|uniref:NAD(P)H-dependent oxidoreductase n=1 Tax=Hyphobacterium lacteum TaxID=3116575 RepID=A0ABU7LQA4_9PROT|nr:NAD(P)H-dependent oxidoreductase [Hyphobacterium sp. HN65]MEE2525524.1 NAD(P)H-dependent oxidoreductase [Hyphobacterium sp. HN65]